MNREDIEHMWKVASNNPNHDTNWHDPVVVAFAALVASAEREACAKVCEKVAVDYYTRIGREHEPYMRATAEDCALHIRAREQSQVCCEEYNTCVRPCTPRGRNFGQKEEREACAKVCDARYMGDNNREDMEAKRCADAIRARGNT